MELLKMTNIHIEYGTKEILNIDELTLYTYDRIGLIGANGSGKTTLLKLINDNLTGEITVVDQLENETLETINDFSVAGIIGLLNFESPKPSGGELTRIKLLNALSKSPDFILADEPTSHLDEEGIHFLIHQLKNQSVPYLIISHDRYFLDQTVDKIWELQDGKITEYWGNYSDYHRQKQQEIRTQQEVYQQALKEKKRLEASAKEKIKQAQQFDKKPKNKNTENKNTENGGRLSHQKSTGSKQKKLHQQAKSLQKRIEEIVGNLDAPATSRQVRFRQSIALELHNPYPIMAENLSKEVGGKILFQNTSFSFPLGEKIAILGPNGSGKSTLMKMIVDKETGINLSPKAQIGYFSQDSYLQSTDQKILDYLMENCDYHLSHIRAVLGFQAQDLPKKIQVLSGGERIKLQLAKLLTGRYNILILDEPANYLDLGAIRALETLIQNYPGTLLFITHDQQLRDNVATRIYEIKDKKLVLVK